MLCARVAFSCPRCRWSRMGLMTYLEEIRAKAGRPGNARKDKDPRLFIFSADIIG